MTVTIDGTTGIDKVQDGSIVYADLDSNIPLGTKNLIINGNMQIAQRGTSVSGKTTGGYDTVDRFIYINSGETITEEQSTDVPTGQGFSNSFKATITTANTPTGTQQAYIATRLEAQNLQHLKFGTANAESLTLSFWIKTNFTDQITLWLWNPDANRHIAYALNVAAADTWQKVTWNIDGDTAGAIDNDNGIGLQLRWILSSGSSFQGGTLDTSWAALTTAGRYQGQGNFTGTTSNYINITGVQLEIGDTATPFENRMYSQELAMCQRYYYKMSGASNYLRFATGFVGAGSTTTAYCYFHPPVTMRDKPTSIDWSASIGLWNGGAISAISALAIEASAASTTSVNLQVTSTGLTQYTPMFIMGNNSSTASIAVSAEL